MADIKVSIQGDGSGASSAFKDVAGSVGEFGNAVGAGAEKVKIAFETIEKATQKVIEFGIESVKAFEDQAKADRQLERAAGDLTEVFKKQASAFQSQLGVSDDMVEKMQTMLLTFGEAPANVQATTQAILDYSARTGEDAVGATKALLSAAQSGKTAFKDLGLEYDKTGVASKDLANITQALSDKIGGTAAAEADSFTGRANRAKQALEEMKETFGGLIVSFIEKTGIVERLSQTFAALNNALNSDEREKKAKAFQHQLEDSRTKLVMYTEAATRAETELNKMILAPKVDMAAVESQTRVLESLRKDVERTEKAYHDLATGEGQAKLSEKGSDRETGKGSEAKDAAALKAKQKAHAQAEAEALAFNMKMFEIVEKGNEDERDEEAKQMQWSIDYDLKSQKEREKAFLEFQAAEAKHYEEGRKAIQKELQHEMDDAEKQTDKFEKQMGQAGQDIAVIFINEMASVLETAMSDGEIDALESFGNVAAGILEIAGLAIGSYFNMPQVGAAVGSLAGSAVKDATKHKNNADKLSAFQQENKKHHDGGWVDSYHAGGWPGMGTDEEMIAAQRGERVLSRSEVQRMGGPQGVDSQARGGSRGGMNINVTTMDSQSFREFLGDRGGRGLYNALRTGQGMLIPVFGR